MHTRINKSKTIIRVVRGTYCMLCTTELTHVTRKKHQHTLPYIHIPLGNTLRRYTVYMYVHLFVLLCVCNLILYSNTTSHLILHVPLPLFLPVPGLTLHF